MLPVFSGHSRKYAVGNRPTASFTVLNAQRILIDVQAPQGEALNLWSAGWINASILDSSAPIFSVLASWERMPLGASYFTMPAMGLIKVELTLHSYVPSSFIKVWA